MKHSPGFEKLVQETLAHVNEISVEDVTQALQNNPDFVLVDVREEGEFVAGHLPQAIHIGKGVIERDIEVKIPDVTSKIVLYCGGGYRSVLAAANLQKMGYQNVLSMSGGWREWNNRNLPTQKPR
jgi:rhodanese-related sulfurtransferase